MKRFRILALFLAFMLLMSFGVVSAETEKLSFEAQYYNELIEEIMNTYKFDADALQILQAVAGKVLTEHPEMLEELIDVSADQFDQYTTYYTKEEMELFSQNFNLEYVGIGLTLERIKGAIRVSKVFFDSPAETAGVKEGDLVLKVDGQDVTDFGVQELIRLISEKAEATVSLELQRGEEHLFLNVERKHVETESVYYKILESGIGYLQISTFNANAVKGVFLADAYFRDVGVDRLIIDLRGNPGGDIKSVVECLSFFVPQGRTLLTTEYRDAKRNYFLRSVGDLKTPHYQLAVLMNRDSASGAELFAGNIQDYKLGTVIGTTSFGKGTVQELSPLYFSEETKGCALKLTMAEYVLPSGRKVTDVGITPDIYVRNPKRYLNFEEMTPFEYMGLYQEGDSGKGVLAIKERLSAIGYYVGDVDEVYDRELTIAVREFQYLAGFDQTGTMDIDLQIFFNNVLDEIKIEQDDQLTEAISFLTKK